MNRKILLSVMLIGVMMFGIGMGTYAWFTSQATSTNNEFTTGTLNVNNGEGFDLVQVGSVTLNNIKPGDQESFTFSIDNTGSLDMKYRFKLTEIAGELTTGDHPLQVSIDGINWRNIDEQYFEGNPDWTLTPDAAAVVYTLHVRMPESAGNEYQGDTGAFKVVVEATQTTNTGWTE